MLSCYAVALLLIAVVSSWKTCSFKGKIWLTTVVLTVLGLPRLFEQEEGEAADGT